MKTPPRHISMPGTMYVDERVTLLDHKLVAYIGAHLETNGWLRATVAELAEKIGKSRAMVNQRIVKLVGWGYVAMRGDVGTRSWRVILDPADETVARAVVTPSPRQATEKKQRGDEITVSGDAITTDGDAITTGDGITTLPLRKVSPTPPSKESPPPETSPSEATPLREQARARDPTGPPTKRLTEDWSLTPERLAKATDRGLTAAEASYEHGKFIDHFTQTAQGRKQRRTERGWERSWTNWLDRCDSCASTGGSRGPQPQGRRSGPPDPVGDLLRDVAGDPKGWGFDPG